MFYYYFFFNIIDNEELIVIICVKIQSVVCLGMFLLKIYVLWIIYVQIIIMFDKREKILQLVFCLCDINIKFSLVLFMYIISEIVF